MEMEQLIDKYKKATKYHSESNIGKSIGLALLMGLKELAEAIKENKK